MRTDAWTQTVRNQLALGRLLPLGGPEDGAWITEQAAVRALGRAAAEIPGVRLGALRVGPVPLEPVSEPAVPAPASALPPGPLRIEADFTASLGQPLPETADQLRSALLHTAAERLGLATSTADLRISDLHEGPHEGPREGPKTEVTSGVATRGTRPAPEGTDGRGSHPVHPVTGTASGQGPAGEIADVAAGVPGVARLTAVLGSRPVRLHDHVDPPRRHVEIHFAVAPGHHPLHVARAVRKAVAAAAAGDTTGPVTVAVLITETGV